MAKFVHLFIIALILTAMITSSEAGFGLFKKFKKFGMLKAGLGLKAAKFGKLGLLGLGGLGIGKKLLLKPKLLKAKKLKFLG